MQIIDTWQRSASRLIAVAAGREAAELVVQNCRLVNVNSREILDGWEVAVVKGRFAYVDRTLRIAWAQILPFLMQRENSLFQDYVMAICTLKVGC